MAVLSYREVVPRTFSHKFGESPTASRKFVCTLDGETNTQAILNAIGIGFGSTHPEYSYLLCGSGQVTETDPYHAEVTYDYELPSQPSADYDTSPLSRADVWSFTTGGIVVPTMQYHDGTAWQPLVNTAGELFEGVTTVEGEVKAQISGNRAAFPTTLALAATNRVNDASYAGGGPGTWLCTGISGQQQVEVVNGSELSYWAVTVTLSYRESKHGVWLPNVGYNQLVDGELKPCTVEYLGDQIPASAPMPLDTAGAQKSAGEMPDVDYYETHLSANFNALFGTPPS